MLLSFELLRGLKNPRRVAIRVAIGTLAYSVVFVGLYALLAVTSRDSQPDYSGGLRNAALVIAAIVVLLTAVAAFQARLTLRSTRWLTDKPHDLEAYFSSLLITPSLMSLVAPSFGFVGAVMFHDLRYLLGCIALGVVPIVVSWPTKNRWTTWEAYLRERGKLRAPAPEIPAAWHPDPMGRHELRFWDGTRWTPYVIDSGVRGHDEIESSAAGA